MTISKLLFFIDEGGFDDYTKLFVDLGYEVDFETSQRRAVKLAKKNSYEVLVAEFNYNPEFRDRVSNIESLLATMESHSPKAKIVILYDPINQAQLDQLQQRYRMDKVLSFPILEQDIHQAVS